MRNVYLYDSVIENIANMKKLKCNVCGLNFTPLNDEHHYVAQCGNVLYDAYDCPQCGCQIHAQQRYPRVKEN